MTKAHARDCSILAARSRTGPAARLTPCRSWSFVKSPVGRRYSRPPVNEPVNETWAWTHTQRGDPMSAPAIKFDDGAVYERMMGKWSGLTGRALIDWLSPPPNLRW